MAQIVLTADRGSFTEYAGVSTLGYVACMPSRIVPRIMMDTLFTPPSAHYKNGETVRAPYALRKVESILYNSGFTDIVVSPPEMLEKVVGPETKLIGITVHDPLGLSPVAFKLTMLFGGGPSWTADFFSELSAKIGKLKSKYNFKVFAGGPATWQIAMERPEWLDSIFYGEAELDLQELARKAINGDPLPKEIKGRDPKVDQIPTIIKPSRFGEVQVTRGCPRGCQFCSITPETYRSIPIEDILKEVNLNLESGYRNVELLTDDILLYGSKRLVTSHEAVVSLFDQVKKAGAEQIYFPHISSPAVLDSPKTVMELSEIAEYHKYRAEAPVVGLENGSERIISKYMRGKPFPYRPEDWKNVIIESTGIMNDAFITPCYTMTIGFSDETNEDVEKSINMVNEIFDSGARAWVFPLAVIPMGSSRIRHNPFPLLEKLPTKYWELLYISWKNDLQVTRQMLPEMTKRMGSGITRFIVNMVMDRTFSHIENVFRELMETNGKKAYDYSNVDLNSVTGVLRTMYWLGLTAFLPGTRKSTKRESAVSS